MGFLGDSTVHNTVLYDLLVDHSHIFGSSRHARRSGANFTLFTRLSRLEVQTTQAGYFVCDILRIFERLVHLSFEYSRKHELHPREVCCKDQVGVVREWFECL